MKVVLAASDLDRTLIYSQRALGLSAGANPELTCVEIYKDEPASFMTSSAARTAVALAETATFMPVTTRTPLQLARVAWPGADPAYAVAANGGALIVGGVRDLDWDAHVAQRLSAVAPLEQVWEHVARVCRPHWTSAIRNADGLFCYAVIDRPALPTGFVEEAREWAEQQGWTISLQGRKLYWIPAPLTKAAAVMEAANRIGAEIVLAAGDSLLDRDLLECADLGIRPRHGELYDSGWTHGRVALTQRSGIMAGQEILEWFLSTARNVTG